MLVIYHLCGPIGIHMSCSILPLPFPSPGPGAKAHRERHQFPLQMTWNSHCSCERPMWDLVLPQLSCPMAISIFPFEMSIWLISTLDSTPSPGSNQFIDSTSPRLWVKLHPYAMFFILHTSVVFIFLNFG